jgi:hypothetical protein
MRTLLSASWLAPLALLAACATTTQDGTSSARLPTGVTLLESDRSDCDGTVRVDEDSIAPSSRRDDVVVRAGQNAVFPVEDDDIQWTCVGTDAADTDTEITECPANTSHVRITRSSADDDFLFECYGRRASTSGSGSDTTRSRSR